MKISAKNDIIANLEIGPGNGLFIKKYFENSSNVNVVAIDYSETMCEQVAKYNKNILMKVCWIIKCENALETSFDDETFDKVLTINTLHFWEPVEEQIKELYRILKKGGQLILGFSPKQILEKLGCTKEKVPPSQKYLLMEKQWILL